MTFIILKCIMLTYIIKIKKRLSGKIRCRKAQREASVGERRRQVSFFIRFASFRTEIEVKSRCGRSAPVMAQSIFSALRGHICEYMAKQGGPTVFKKVSVRASVFCTDFLFVSRFFDSPVDLLFVFGTFSLFSV